MCKIPRGSRLIQPCRGQPCNLPCIWHEDSLVWQARGCSGGYFHGHGHRMRVSRPFGSGEPKVEPHPASTGASWATVVRQAQRACSRAELEAGWVESSPVRSAYPRCRTGVSVRLLLRLGSPATTAVARVQAFTPKVSTPATSGLRRRRFGHSKHWQHAAPRFDAIPPRRRPRPVIESPVIARRSHRPQRRDGSRTA